MNLRSVRGGADLAVITFMVRVAVAANAAALLLFAPPSSANCPERREAPRVEPAPGGSTPSRGQRIRAGTEILALVGLHGAYYWINNGLGERNPNWELWWDSTSWRKKLVTLEGVVLDTNPFSVNFFHHPAAGAIYYQVARSNDLSVLESFLHAAAGSALWEYVVEFPEKVSLNDMIITPTGGLAVGEAAARLGAFLTRGENGAARAAGHLLFLPRRIHDRIDGRARPRAASVDALGLPADAWHRFELGLAADVGGPRAGEGLRVSAATELVELPRPLRPGAAMVGPGSTTALSLELGWASAEVTGLRFVARTGLGGVAWQDHRGAAAGGQHILLQGATAYEYATRAYPDGYRDQLGIAHLLGASASGELRAGGVRVRGALEAYGDFAGVRSAALDRYLDGRSPRGIKTPLRKEGYYFSAGGTLRAALEVGAGGVEAGAEVQVDALHSIEGMDRLQHQVTRDFHLQDGRAQQRAWISYAPPGANLRLTPLSIERVQRTGRIGPVETRSTETRVSAGIALRF